MSPRWNFFISSFHVSSFHLTRPVTQEVTHHGKVPGGRLPRAFLSISQLTWSENKTSCSYCLNLKWKQNLFFLLAENLSVSLQPSGVANHGILCGYLPVTICHVEKEKPKPFAMAGNRRKSSFRRWEARRGPLPYNFTYKTNPKRNICDSCV